MQLIDRARDHPEDALVQEDFDAPEGGDAFEEIYKGEVSKSGQAILPSKRSRKIPSTKRCCSDDGDDDGDEGDDGAEDNSSAEALKLKIQNNFI